MIRKRRTESSIFHFLGQYFAYLYDKAMGDKKDFKKFVELVTVLNKTSDQDFSREIQKIFNVDRFLRTIVFEVMFMNWDTYSVWNNNYLLYEDSASNKIEFIAHDFDIAYFDVNMTKVDIFKWYGFSPIPPFPGKTAILTERIMKNPEFLATYTKYFRMYLDRIHVPERLFRRWRVIRDSLMPHIREDNMMSYDCMAPYYECPRNADTFYRRFETMEKFAMMRMRSALDQLNQKHQMSRSEK